MNLKNKILNNAMWIISCKAIKAILTLIVNMITARYLGTSNYGKISYAASLVAFVAPIMKLGFDGIYVQEIVEYPDKEGTIIGTAAILNFCSGIISIVGVVAFAYIANRNETETIIVCAIYSSLLLFQAFEMIQYWFQAKLLSKYSAVAMLISYVVVTIIQIALVVNHVSVYWFALSSSIDYALIALLLYVVYKRQGGQKLCFSKETAGRMLSRGKHFIVASLMITVYQQTDNIMLKLIIGSSASGIYSASHTCASMASFIFAAIIDSFRPSVFEAKGHEERDQKLICLYSIVIYSSLIMSFLITAFSGLIIRIMFGVAFSESIGVLRIAVWFTTFSYIGTIRNIWMLTENKEKYLELINICGAVTNVILNVFMIRLWGPKGAAIASLITQFITNVAISQVLSPLKHNNELLLEAIKIHNLKSLLDLRH